MLLILVPYAYAYIGPLLIILDENIIPENSVSQERICVYIRKS